MPCILGTHERTGLGAVHKAVIHSSHDQALALERTALECLKEYCGLRGGRKRLSGLSGGGEEAGGGGVS